MCNFLVFFFFFHIYALSLYLLVWKVKVNSCRVLPNTAAVGWGKSCMGFYSWTPKYPRWEQVRWMNLQCKEPLIICPFSLKIVTLDFPFLQLFDWFLSVVLEFSWNICLSLTVYVWEWGIWYLTGLDVCRRACTLVGTSLCDWVGTHLFFSWRPAASISTSGKCPTSTRPQW